MMLQIIMFLYSIFPFIFIAFFAHAFLHMHGALIIVNIQIDCYIHTNISIDILYTNTYYQLNVYDDNNTPPILHMILTAINITFQITAN